MNKCKAKFIVKIFTIIILSCFLSSYTVNDQTTINNEAKIPVKEDITIEKIKEEIKPTVNIEPTKPIETVEPIKENNSEEKNKVNTEENKVTVNENSITIHGEAGSTLGQYTITIKDNVFPYHPFELTNLTADEFNVMLEGSYLEGYGECFYKLETEYGVNGLFALAVANFESNLGKHQVNTNNFFGFFGKSGAMSFDSVESGIEHFGKLMNKSWYYNKDIYEIAKVYCGDIPDVWTKNVKSLMDKNYKKLGY